MADNGLTLVSEPTYIIYLEPSHSSLLHDLLAKISREICKQFGPDESHCYMPHCSLTSFFTLKGRAENFQHPLSDMPSIDMIVNEIKDFMTSQFHCLLENAGENGGSVESERSSSFIVKHPMHSLDGYFVDETKDNSYSQVCGRAHCNSIDEDGGSTVRPSTPMELSSSRYRTWSNDSFSVRSLCCPDSCRSTGSFGDNNSRVVDTKRTLNVSLLNDYTASHSHYRSCEAPGIFGIQDYNDRFEHSDANVAANQKSADGACSIVCTPDGYVLLSLSCEWLRTMMEQLASLLATKYNIYIRGKKADHVTLASKRSYETQGNIYRLCSAMIGLRNCRSLPINPECNPHHDIAEGFGNANTNSDASLGQVCPVQPFDFVIYKLLRKSSQYEFEGMHSFKEIARFHNFARIRILLHDLHHIVY